MFASIAGVALALQLGAPAHPLDEGISSIQEILTQERLAQEGLAQEIRYRRHGRPPPCGHGYDLDERDDKCYPNGTVPPRFQSGRIPWSMAAAGGRYHAATAQTSIFATGSAIRRARCQCSISRAARAITIGETATTKCDSAATLNIGPCLAAMAPTSMSGTANVIRTERSRRSISRGVIDITATGTGTEPSGRLKRTHVRLPERYGRRSPATASATTATSEAIVYGFGSHPSGA